MDNYFGLGRERGIYRYIYRRRERINAYLGRETEREGEGKGERERGREREREREGERNA